MAEIETGFAEKTWNGTPYNPAWNYNVTLPVAEVAAEAAANGHNLMTTANGGAFCDCGSRYMVRLGTQTVSVVSGAMFHQCKRRSR